MLSALQAQQAKENNLDSVDEREEREETNRKRRLQREKAKRREEKGEKARQRGKSENKEATSRREETANDEEVEGVVGVEGGCSHCRGSVATECVYLCQKGHLHRDLPGEGCHHCGRRGESQCKSAFMRILRAGGQSSSKGSSRATSAVNISS